MPKIIRRRARNKVFFLGHWYKSVAVYDSDMGWYHARIGIRDSVLINMGSILLMRTDEAFNHPLHS